MENPARTIDSFKYFVRNNLNDNFKESELRTFISEIENDKRIKSHYDTLSLVKELEGLEKQYFELRNNIDFVPFYKSFLNRTKEYALSQSFEVDRKVLNYLYTAAFNKASILRKRMNGKTVVDVNRYLNTIEHSINDVIESRHIKIIQGYRDDYRKILNDKIQHANDLIETQIDPEINEFFDEMNRNIKILINEIDERKNTIKDTVEDLEREKNSIQRVLTMRTIFFPLKLAAAGLIFFGPVGAAASVTLLGVTSIAEGTVSSSIFDKRTKFPPSLNANIGLMSRTLEVYNSKPERLAEKLTIVIEKLNATFSEILESQSERIAFFEKTEIFTSKVQEVKNTKSHSITNLNYKQQELKKIELELKDFINSKKAALKQNQEESNDIEIENGMSAEVRKKLIHSLNNIEDILNIGEIALNFIKIIHNDDRQLQRLNVIISKEFQYLKKLEMLEDQIFDIMVPVIYQFEQKFNAILNSVNGSSSTELVIAQSALSNVKSIVYEITNDMPFDVRKNLQRCIDKVDEGFSILIDIYDRIDTYSDSVKSVEYMAQIASIPMRDISITNHNTEYNDALNDLNLIIQSNMLLEKYELALHAFKQNYFPFAVDLLKKFELPMDIQINDMDSLRSTIIKEIRFMKDFIDENKATIATYSDLQHEKKLFNSYSIGSSPFYVWKYDEISDEFRNLLNGGKILVKADISKGINYSSVKFNDIGINFKFANEQLQTDFESALKKFKLTLTMVGNNYYRCGERFYHISVDQDISVSYFLDKDERNHWIDPNSVYTMIRNNNPFLSPYVLWSIQLTNATDTVTFDQLKVYQNEMVDLELVGQGYYIEQDSDFDFDICNEYLDTFYNVEHTKLRTNLRIETNTIK